MKEGLAEPMVLRLPERNTADNATLAHKVRGVAWIARTAQLVPVLAVALSALALGCAAEASDSNVEARVTIGSVGSAIFGGAKDDDGEAIPGVVALRVGTGGTFELCSGALVAPNVVLTARHCITKNVTTSVSCDENGRSANGAHVKGDEDPSAIGVYLGANPSFARAPVSVARAVVAPTGPYLCNSDIALVVLATPILTVEPLRLRIHSPARAGEMIRSVGYGQNDHASPIGTRFRRAGVEVLAQGKAVSPSKTPLGEHEFEVGKSICQGDSGGPALSEETGAVIGVVSRGGGCDDNFGHIYTTTAGFEDLFADAFRLAEATPTLEAGDVPTTAAHAKSATASGSPNADPAPSAGSCSLGLPGTSATGTGGLLFIMAALGTLGLARRRRA